jgi:hypothetical protein
MSKKKPQPEPIPARKRSPRVQLTMATEEQEDIIDDAKYQSRINGLTLSSAIFQAVREWTIKAEKLQ